MVYVLVDRGDYTAGVAHQEYPRAERSRSWKGWDLICPMRGTCNKDMYSTHRPPTKLHMLGLRSGKTLFGRRCPRVRSLRLRPLDTITSLQ